MQNRPEIRFILGKKPFIEEEEENPRGESKAEHHKTKHQRSVPRQPTVEELVVSINSLRPSKISVPKHLKLDLNQEGSNPNAERHPRLREFVAWLVKHDFASLPNSSAQHEQKLLIGFNLDLMQLLRLEVPLCTCGEKCVASSFSKQFQGYVPSETAIDRTIAEEIFYTTPQTLMRFQEAVDQERTKIEIVRDEVTAVRETKRLIETQGEAEITLIAEKIAEQKQLWPQNMVMLQYMTPQEWEAWTVDFKILPKPSPCVLCIRHHTFRAMRLVQHFPELPKFKADCFLQSFATSRNGVVGEYDPRLVVTAPDNVAVLFPAPSVLFLPNLLQWVPLELNTAFGNSWCRFPLAQYGFPQLVWQLNQSKMLVR